MPRAELKTMRFPFQEFAAVVPQASGGRGSGSEDLLRYLMIRAPAPTPILILTASTTMIQATIPTRATRRARYESAGPALSDPCDTTKAMMRAEEREWAL
jgi:hypothetical protein